MDVHEYRVLLAVGRRVIAEELRHDLRGIGFARIHHVANGFDALMAIKKEPLDLMMIEADLPGMDGLDVIRQMRRIPRFVGPRTLLVTQGADREMVQKAAALGVREFLIRPFSTQGLKDRLERLLDTTLI